MNDTMRKLIGTDVVAALMHEMRQQFGNVPDWDELEPLIYDTIKEFDQLPEMTLTVDMARLRTDEGLQAFVNNLTASVRDYGIKCRREVLRELVRTRVKLHRVAKAAK